MGRYWQGVGKGQMASFSTLILPIATLCGLVILLPWLLLPRGSTSQPRLAGVILATALTTCCAGALILAFLHASLNGGLGAASPLSLALHFLARSTLFAMLWGPLLALVWLIRAQEMNRRIGLTMSDPGQSGGSNV